MTALRVAAALMAINAVMLHLGLRRGGGSGSIKRPSWLLPSWVRVLIPFALAAGLWGGQGWAWWGALVFCVWFAVMSGIAGPMLWFGGFFRGDGARFTVMHYILSLGTELGVVMLLLVSLGERS